MYLKCDDARQNGSGWWRIVGKGWRRFATDEGQLTRNHVLTVIYISIYVVYNLSVLAPPPRDIAI